MFYLYQKVSILIFTIIFCDEHQEYSTKGFLSFISNCDGHQPFQRMFIETFKGNLQRVDQEKCRKCVLVSTLPFAQTIFSEKFFHF
jgi:hypothetical protein